MARIKRFRINPIKSKNLGYPDSDSLKIKIAALGRDLTTGYLKYYKNFFTSTSGKWNASATPL